jgi:ribosomal-protein-alanine N-acetyltransferase
VDAAIRPLDPEDWEQLFLFPAAARFESNQFLIAIVDRTVAAFLAWRRVAPDEIEILHLETLASFRKKGIARQLLKSLKREPGNLFLEVRPSNLPACHLYQTEGFTRIGVRKDYYSQPSEEAIVLKFHSC